MPAGRPSKYKTEYCQQLIDWMSQGLSFESFAAHCNCGVQLLYDWAEANPEFLEAKAIGFARNREFYERLGIKAILGQAENFNSVVWVFNMKNRFGWRDNKDTTLQITGANGGPIEITALSSEERKKRILAAQDKLKALVEAEVIDEDSE